VDAYCERVGMGVLAEPLNAFSNLSFLLAAWAAWVLASRETSEMRQQTVQMGRSMIEWLKSVRPEQVRALAGSEAFRAHREADDGRMVTGEPAQVVKRLRELQEQAQVDELVMVTPSIDRARRTASLEAIAGAW